MCMFTDQYRMFTNDLSEILVIEKSRCGLMRRSKLESYEAILEALVKKPQPIDRLAYETDIDCTIICKRVGFLVDNGLVEERPLPDNTEFAITERGVAVFKTLNFRKYLEKVSSSISAISEAMQALPMLPRDYEEQSGTEDEKY